MQLYVIGIIIVACLGAVTAFYFMGRKSGKEAGRRKAEKDVKAWLSKKYKDIYADLIGDRDAPFGRVRKKDTVWGTTPKART